MSDYQWTEEQIQAVVDRFSHRKGWVTADSVRPNKDAKAPDIRRLMELLVDGGHAIDNKESPSSGKYRIRFDREEQPRFFSPGLLSTIDIQQILSCQGIPISGDCFTIQVITMTVERRWAIIISILDAFDGSRKWRWPSQEKELDRDDTETLLNMAREVAALYKALKIGWDDIKVAAPDITDHDALFKVVLRAKFIADLGMYLNPPSSRGALKRVQNISGTLDFVLAVIDQDPNGWRDRPLDALLQRVSNYKDVKPRAEGAHRYNGYVGYDDCKLETFQKDVKALAERALPLKGYVSILLFISNFLSMSTRPEVVEAANEWIKACMAGIDIPRRRIRRESSKKRNRAE